MKIIFISIILFIFNCFNLFSETNIFINDEFSLIFKELGLPKEIKTEFNGVKVVTNENFKNLKNIRKETEYGSGYLLSKDYINYYEFLSANIGAETANINFIYSNHEIIIDTSSLKIISIKYFNDTDLKLPFSLKFSDNMQNIINNLGNPDEYKNNNMAYNNYKFNNIFYIIQIKFENNLIKEITVNLKNEKFE